MSIDRLQPKAPLSAVQPRRQAPTVAPGPVRLAQDGLALASGSGDAKARSLVQEADALRAKGLTMLADKKLSEAFKEVESLDLALSMLTTARSVDAELEFGVQHQVGDLAKDHADSLGSGLKAARELMALSSKLDDLNFVHAGDAVYNKALDAIDSYDTLLAVLPGNGSEAIWKMAGKLAEKAPAPKEQGDAAAKVYVAKAEEADKLGLDRAAGAFYKRALGSTETVEMAQRIQQSAYERGYDGYHHYMAQYDYDIIKWAERKAERIENPPTWWNPFSWVKFLD